MSPISPRIMAPFIGPILGTLRITESKVSIIRRISLSVFFTWLSINFSCSIIEHNWKVKASWANVTPKELAAACFNWLAFSGLLRFLLNLANYWSKVSTKIDSSSIGKLNSSNSSLDAFPKIPCLVKIHAYSGKIWSSTAMIFLLK